jgi:hypothetical protein
MERRSVSRDVEHSKRRRRAAPGSNPIIADRGDNARPPEMGGGMYRDSRNSLLSRDSFDGFRTVTAAHNAVNRP